MGRGDLYLHLLQILAKRFEKTFLRTSLQQKENSRFSLVTSLGGGQMCACARACAVFSLKTVLLVSRAVSNAETSLPTLLRVSKDFRAHPKPLDSRFRTHDQKK